MSGISSNFSSDDLLLSKINDAIILAQTRNKPCFVGFLDEYQIATAQKTVQRFDFYNYLFFGGIDNAQRKLFGAFNDGMIPCESDFPVSLIGFKYRKCDKVFHKDILGTIMAQGVTRESVGDIFIGDGYSVAMVKSEIEQYLKSQIYKIGGIGVTVEDACVENVPSLNKPEEIIITTSSMRLDNIVAALACLSRDKTSKLISSGNVFVNGLLQQNNSFVIKSGDKITIRKKGKFLINNVLGTTKKNRFKILVNQFR